MLYLRNSTVFNIPWKIVFTINLWRLWIMRNKLAHGGNSDHISNLSHFMAERTKLGPVETVISMERRNIRLGQVRICKWICWEAPSEGWITLTTDGIVSGNPGLAGAGGLLRDHRGHWISGFYKGIGVTHSVMAELCGLLEGLKLALSLNMTKINIQLEARLTVDLLSDNYKDNNLLNPLPFECRNLLARFPHSSIKASTISLRKPISVLTLLAKKGLEYQVPLTVMCSPLETLSLLPLLI